MLGLPARLVPTAPAHPPGLLGLIHHGACHQGQGAGLPGTAVPAWGRMMRRRCSRLEKAADGGGCPLWKLRAGSGDINPLGWCLMLWRPRFSCAVAGGPVWRWGCGCWVSGGHGIKPFCTGEGRWFSCKGRSPIEQAGPWEEAGDSEPTLGLPPCGRHQL